LELDLIHLLLVHPQKIGRLPRTDGLTYFTNSEVRHLAETLERAVADERSPDAVEAVGRLNPGPVREELLKKLMAERRPEEDKMLDRLLDDVVGQIRRR
jgi:hypothetical protein